MTHSTVNQATYSRLAANDDSFKATSGLLSDDIFEKQFVSVSEYRHSISWLFDQCNRHYHACVGLREFESFGEQLQRVFSLVYVQACKRAKADDLASFDRAIEAAHLCAEKNQLRINNAKEIQI
jgi:hypothetical protein